MSRALEHLSIDELHELAVGRRRNFAVLGQVKRELSYHATPQARQVERRILGVLSELNDSALDRVPPAAAQTFFDAPVGGNREASIDTRDPIALALREFREGCGWYCGTCGGHAGRVWRLSESYRQNRRGYLAGLGALDSIEFAEIGTSAPLARALLDVVSYPRDRENVLDAWSAVVASSPDVALIVLYVAGAHLPLSRRLLAVMVQLSQQHRVLAEHLAGALGPAALRHHHLHDRAMSALQAQMRALENWQHFEAAADRHAQLEEERWEEVCRRAERARAREVSELRKLPLPARLLELSRRSTSFIGLEPVLAEATEDDLRLVPSDSALELARLIPAGCTGPWQDLKRRLVAIHGRMQREQQRLRGQLRQAEIDLIAAGSPVHRLRHMAQARRSLSFWPVSWANVDKSAVAELSSEERLSLQLWIRNEARRIRTAADRAAWRTLAQRLGDYRDG